MPDILPEYGPLKSEGPEGPISLRPGPAATVSRRVSTIP